VSQRRFVDALGLPLVSSAGPSAEMRQAMGIAFVFGTLGVTLFGLVFTPVFYSRCVGFRAQERLHRTLSISRNFR
jgi:hypothetical protein